MLKTASSTQVDTAPSARWCEDPLGRYELRWWDGTAWTANVTEADLAPTVDPYGTAPTAVSAPVTPVAPGESEEARPTAVEPRLTRSRRGLWVGVGVVVSAFALIVVLIFAVGGDGQAADPRLGTFEGVGEDVTVDLVVSGDPPSISEVTVEGCGSLSSRLTINFGHPIAIEDGSFEISVPLAPSGFELAPSGFEMTGQFIDSGRRVEGRLDSAGCSTDWQGTLR